MSSFNLCLADPKANEGQFRFAFPRALLRADIFNPTDHEIVLTLRAPEMREVTFHLNPGQLQRLKTGWSNRASMVKLEADGLGSLRFDNFAYTADLWTRLDWSE